MKKVSIAKDILLYLAGAMVPMAVLTLRSPIYTRIFSPELYGQFSLINITFSYLSTVFFSWILSCSLRYYHKYKKTGKLTEYQATVSFLLLCSSLVFILIGVAWYLLAHNTNSGKLALWASVYFISEKYFHTLLVPLKQEGKAGYFNILKASNIILGFAFLLLLTFIYNLSIEAFFIAPALFNILFILVLSLIKVAKPGFRKSSMKNNNLKRFFHYGRANIGVAFGLFLLISSDRYIIALFGSNSEVGIYNQVYNIAQISLTAITSVFQAATNPTLFKELEHRPAKSTNTLANYAGIAIFIYIPLALLGSLFSKELATILLGEAFRVSWPILPWIFASILINGVVHFYTLRLKFQNRLKTLTSGVFIAAGVNIILNMIFVPVWGYESAAITTLISYSIMLLYYWRKVNFNIIENTLFTKRLLVALKSSLIIVCAYCMVRISHYWPDKLQYNIMEALVYSGLFVVLTWKQNPLRTIDNE